MIGKGSTVELKTEKAIYSPCEVVSISKTNITVIYSIGSKRNNETGEVHNNKKTETIAMKDVVSLQERS